VRLQHRYMSTLRTLPSANSTVRNSSFYGSLYAYGPLRAIDIRTLGVREVAGSNPVVPTILIKLRLPLWRPLRVVAVDAIA
jgi:hypothetical protein